MNLIIILVFIIIVIICFYYINRSITNKNIRNIFLVMKNEDKTNKKSLNKLKIVESDDRMIRLIKTSNTNMTELGMAIDKSSVNIHDLDIRHIGSERELISKFKNMTMELIDNTKNINPDELYDDSDEDIDLLRTFKRHWEYYALIFDTIFIHECKNNVNLEEYEECYDHWKKYYKDQPLETLRSHNNDIINKFEKAIKYVDQRKLNIEQIQKDLTDLF